MPLLDGDDEDTVSANIRELVASGHDQEQAVAIALDHARRTRREDESFAGLPVVVENPAGSVRRWSQPDGSSGETVMTCDYGYFDGTRGADREGVDVFLGPDRGCRTAYVVHQMRPPDFTKYDEDKVMAGFSSKDEAVRAYLDNYDDPRFLGAVTEIPVEELPDRLRRPGSLRADAACRARVWLERRYRVDLSGVEDGEVVRRAARILGAVADGGPVESGAVAARLDDWDHS